MPPFGMGGFGGGVRITVSREHLFSDAFDAIQNMPREELDNNWIVTFRDEEGQLEEGIGQGVFKEFISL